MKRKAERKRRRQSRSAYTRAASMPYEFAVGLGRALDLPVVDYALAEYLRRSSMAMYDRATPDGYPEQDEFWVDANASLQRWHWGLMHTTDLRDLIAEVVRGLLGNDRIDIVLPSHEPAVVGMIRA